MRLVAFNLDLQKEIYRKENFVLRDLPSMSDAMNKIELGLVDEATFDRVVKPDGMLGR